jgi:hypothetical protein
VPLIIIMIIIISRKVWNVMEHFNVPVCSVSVTWHFTVIILASGISGRGVRVGLKSAYIS